MAAHLDSRSARTRGPAHRLLRTLVVLAVLAIAAVVALAWFRVGEPKVSIEASKPGIGRKSAPVAVRLSEPSRGLAAVEVQVVQEGKEPTVVAEKTYPERRPFWAFWGPRTTSDELRVEIGKDTVPGLEEGRATIRVIARRPGTPLRKGAPVIAELELPVRLRPPLISVVSTQNYVRQGGSGVVVYRVGASALADGGRDGVRSGDDFFPGYALPGGQAGERFALFAAPWNLDDPSKIRLVAADAIGNQAETAFVDEWFPHPPRSDTIHLSDPFMQKAVSEIMAQTPDLQDKGDLLQNYLQINGDLRRKEARRLRELGADSKPEFLWHRAFLALPSAAVMSHFADRRTYLYQGRAVDHQTHLGYDLASVRQAEVPAANRGVVVLARYFGIYGNAVVIDHGYGLMSLYGHLSSIAVEEGQEVDRGQVLGHTGATGLAGGDHLHFTLMIRGEPVTPVEWWDGKWIRDRIASKLGAALPYRPTS